MASTQIVHAHDEKTVGIERLTGADHVVPPPYVSRVIRVNSCDMMRGIERMAHQHGIVARGIQRAIGFVSELVIREGASAL